MYKNSNQKLQDLVDESQFTKLVQIAEKNYHDSQIKRFNSKYETDKAETFLFRRFKAHLRTRKIPYALNGLSLTLCQKGQEYAGLTMRFCQSGYVHVWKVADDFNKRYSLYAEHLHEFIAKLQKHGLIKQSANPQ